MDSKELGSALKQVKHAAHPDALRDFACVWLEPDGETTYRVIATDGIRIAVAEREDPELKAQLGETVAVHVGDVPVLLYWLARNDVFKISLGVEGYVGFQSYRSGLTLNRHQAKLPDWRTVVNQMALGDGRKRVLMNATFLSEAAASFDKGQNLILEMDGPLQAISLLVPNEGVGNTGYREFIMPKRETSAADIPKAL